MTFKDNIRTARNMKLPNFKVEHHGYGYSANWTSGDRRYHFWLSHDGSLKDDVLHSNPIEGHGHRPLRMKSQKWAPIIDGIMQKIASGDLLAQARTEYDDELKRDLEERERSYHAALQKTLAKALVELPTELATQIAALPVETRLAFMKKIEER